MATSSGVSSIHYIRALVHDIGSLFGGRTKSSVHQFASFPTFDASNHQISDDVQNIICNIFGIVNSCGNCSGDNTGQPV